MCEVTVIKDRFLFLVLKIRIKAKAIIQVPDNCYLQYNTMDDKYKAYALFYLLQVIFFLTSHWKCKIKKNNSKTKDLSNNLQKQSHFKLPTIEREHDYIAFDEYIDKYTGKGCFVYLSMDEYYNEPIGRSFGNCDIYNTTITWLHKHDHMARYFPSFLVFGAKFQYFDNGE